MYSPIVFSPLGNFAGSFGRLPWLSRDAADQQSSRVSVLYPAASRPLLTIASAVCRTRDSSRPLHANAFQLFHPMVGGVALVASLIIPGVVRPGTKPGIAPWPGGVRSCKERGKIVSPTMPMAKQRTKADL